MHYGSWDKFNRGSKRVARIAAVAALAALSACQTADLGGAGDGNARQAATDDDFTSEDLRGYCPPVKLREGTAILRTFTANNDNNPDEMIYQATITDVTRVCKHRNGQLLMTIAAAGRVLKGPKGSPGPLVLPVRVAIRQGEDVPYSQLTKLTVNVTNEAATQFSLVDDQVAVPEPAVENLQVFAGFDEGPYDTP